MSSALENPDNIINVTVGDFRIELVAAPSSVYYSGETKYGRNPSPFPHANLVIHEMFQTLADKNPEDTEILSKFGTAFMIPAARLDQGLDYINNVLYTATGRPRINIDSKPAIVSDILIGWHTDSKEIVMGMHLSYLSGHEYNIDLTIDLKRIQPAAPFKKVDIQIVREPETRTKDPFHRKGTGGGTGRHSSPYFPEG